MNRRKFFALLPAAPVALAIWPSESKAAPEGTPRPGELSLILNSTETPVSTNYKGTNIFVSDHKEIAQVSMAVGRDGNLWLKGKDNEWKRVVTE